MSDQLTDTEWLAEIAEIGRDRGYYEAVGRDHGALFIDESLDVLLVSFDTVQSARTGSESGIPHGMLQAEINGWSHLSIIANGPTWFRDPALWRYFDRLTDDAFFEDFDRVIFFGAGMGGYAAAAYSVASPGATVILAAPVATLDPKVAPWDDRYPTARRKDFETRYGYAPDMLDAADQAMILYDPFEDLDAMHAALFRGPQVQKIRFRHAGPRIGAELRAMNALEPLFKAAAEGTLTSDLAYHTLRRRREHGPYLKHLLNRVHIEEREYLAAMLCRAVLERRESPRFRHHYKEATKRLADTGRMLPPMRKPKKASDLFPKLHG